MRVLAGAANVAAVLAAFLSFLASVAGYVLIRERLNPEWVTDRKARDVDPADHRWMAAFQSRGLRAACWGAAAGLSVAFRNSRSPGFRIVGLRRVDARTGGSVSVRSVLLALAFDQVAGQVSTRLFRSRSERGRVRRESLSAQIAAIQREHADDPAAAQRALMDLYEANGIKPLAGCGWALLRGMLWQAVLALGIRDGRTVRDRISGTSVIADRDRLAPRESVQDLQSRQ